MEGKLPYKYLICLEGVVRYTFVYHNRLYLLSIIDLPLKQEATHTLVIILNLRLGMHPVHKAARDATDHYVICLHRRQQIYLA